MQNRYKKTSPRSPALSPPKIGNRRSLCDVYTNTDTDYVCQKCAEREKFDYTESEEFRASYIKSIDYINCCHSLMNELLHRKTGRSTVTLPDMPNFMDVLAALQKDSSDVQERGTVTDEKKRCDKSSGQERNVQPPDEGNQDISVTLISSQISGEHIKQTQDCPDESESNLSDEEMDRYAQELLLASTDNSTPPRKKHSCFNQSLRTQYSKIPQSFCALPNLLCGQQNNKRHLSNLSLLQPHPKNDEFGSDTDYIPSDNDAEAPLKPQNKCTTPTISHPLKLNQRSLHLLDEKAMSKIGLFTENGELPHDAIRILEAERNYRSKDARNKQFRRRRSCGDNNGFEKKRTASSGSADLSDIKSESELEEGCKRT